MDLLVTVRMPDIIEAVNKLCAVLGPRELTLNTTNATTASALAPAEIQAPTVAPITAPNTVPTLSVVSVQPIQPPVPTPAAIPTTVPTYDLDQLAVAATQLIDSGKREVVVNLLASMGVSALTQLPREHYGAFANALIAEGVKL